MNSENPNATIKNQSSLSKSANNLENNSSSNLLVKGLSISIIVAAFFSGIASGYYGYINSISSTNHFFVYIWYLLLPISYLTIFYSTDSGNEKAFVPILISPLVTILGFYLVYEHPDIFTAGFLSCAIAILLCLVLYFLIKKFRGKIDIRKKVIRNIQKVLLGISILYALAMISFLCIPMELQYETFPIKNIGSGILNAASTDDWISYRDDYGNNKMYCCDMANVGDLYTEMRKVGYSNLPNGKVVRKELQGILLPILPVRDNGLLNSGKEKDQKESESTKTNEQSQKEIGIAFLEENKTKEGVYTSESGLQYKKISEGSGPKPTKYDKVKVHYTGKFIDGTVFDSSVERGEPIVFELSKVIIGWGEGLQLMPVGSKYVLYIPYELAYGDKGAGQRIPPYTMLIFEVELLEIDK